MKKLLFGWLFKSQFELSVLDSIIGIIEIIITFIIILAIREIIKFIVDKIKGDWSWKKKK